MEKLWVLEYTAPSVMCFYIKEEDDVEDILKENNINPDNCFWMTTSVDVELEIHNAEG